MFHTNGGVLRISPLFNQESGNISDFLQTFPANLHKTLNGLWTLYRENTEAEKTKHVTPPKTNIYPLKNAGTGR